VVAGQVRAAQIDAVKRYTPWLMSANIGNALAVAAVCCINGQIWFIAPWTAAVIAIASFSILSWLKTRHNPAPKSVSTRGLKRTIAYAGVLGAIWSLLPALTFASANTEERLVMVWLIAGMMCGSGFALATIPAAGILFASLLAIGTATALLASPDLSTVLIMAVMISYLAVIIHSSLVAVGLLASRISVQIASDEQRDVIGMLLNDFEEHATDWLWATDSALRLRHVSARLSEVIGRSEGDLIGMDAAKLVPVRKRSECTYEESLNQLKLLRQIKSRKPFRDLEIPVIVGESCRIWSLTAKPVFLPSGEFDGYRGVCRDVTAANEAHRAIEHLAKFDMLTGLANRTKLREETEEAIIRLDRRKEAFALFLLDLDHFKFVNDTHGHPVGDALLQKVAERLKGAVREIDSVARLGGDEFAIVLTDIQKPEQAAGLAERIVRELSTPFVLPTCELHIGVSIGIAYAPVDGSDFDTLIRHADLALYRAKSGGRGGYHFFEAALDAAARRRHMLEADLRDALACNSLELYYQPLVDSRTRAVRSFEALMRWNHPTLGMLSPAEFIPLAEEIGLIQQLGAWAVSQACQEALAWPEEIGVSVNLSAVQFRSPSLFTGVKAVLEQTGIRPDRLELEITESLLLDATESVKTILTSLKGLGVLIALDDFGTGYSSLSYLRKYRFDKIKIDRYFVHGVESDPDALAIIDSMMGLARDMRMALTIEGVETEAQMAALCARGRMEIQGYLISRPMPAGQVLGFIEKSTPVIHAPRARRAA
jgi:diguanylate cyclase (GGDEF)-like protein